MLDGYRILVVGASTGIGRAVGMQAAQSGASVAFAARRIDLLQGAVDDVGGSSFAVACDVRVEEQCARAVEAAVERFGGLDAVVYASGKSPLVRFGDADAATWRDVVETNVIGAALVTRAALPHLEASSGRMLLLGSSSVGRPYPGLVAYTTSKAALHEFARGLRNEFPWLRVTTFVVGPTISEFANSWDLDTAVAMHGRWSTEGYPITAPMTAEDMADQIIRVLASGARVEEVHVMPDQPRPGPEGTPVEPNPFSAGTIGSAPTSD
jgi:NADP-dependent 3-hydroxy acid dehydrogenase YdfG